MGRSRSLRRVVLGVGLCMVLVGAGAAAWAGEEPVQVIRLADGTVILGRIVGVQEGDWLIQSRDLGLVRVPGEKVESVERASARKPAAAAPAGGAPAAPGADGGGHPLDPTAAAIQSLQAQIVNDPALFQAILRLADDPEILALIQDPEVLRILADNDLGAAEKDPTFVRLAGHPKIRALMEQVQARQPRDTPAP